MKTITEQLFEKADGLIKLLPEVSDPTGKYHMADDGGVETETGEFLFGLVKVLQPQAILETGTYTGISAMYMAAALANNIDGGFLTTIEFEKVHKDRAEKLWEACEVINRINCVLKSSLEYTPEEQYELMFLDSEPNIRFLELVKFYPYLKDGGYILVHDLHRHLSQVTPPGQPPFWPYGKLPNEIRELLIQDKLRITSFPTPRGLTLFYKPAEGDYRP